MWLLEGGRQWKGALKGTLEKAVYFSLPLSSALAATATF